MRIGGGGAECPGRTVDTWTQMRTWCDRQTVVLLVVVVLIVTSTAR